MNQAFFGTLKLHVLVLWFLSQSNKYYLLYSAEINHSFIIWLIPGKPKIHEEVEQSRTRDLGGVVYIRSGCLAFLSGIHLQDHTDLKINFRLRSICIFHIYIFVNISHIQSDELEMFRMLGMLQKRSSFLVSQMTYREPRSGFSKVIWVHLSDIQRSYLT